MYDKSKKTWSQRLNITKKATSASHPATTPSSVAPQQQYNNSGGSSAGGGGAPSLSKAYHQAAGMHLPALQLSDGGGSGSGGEYLPSALSRSMKYAEPWIYGTVRGIPARPAAYYHQQQQHLLQHSLHHQQLLAQHHGHPHHLATSHHPHAAAIFASADHTLMPTEALAVVICSCPEFLNGTKRDVKKASVCKRCRGSRLPLATIGGTVRLTGPFGPSAKLGSCTGAATMRVVSTSKKMRPSILDPQKDPYDLMRRSRLMSPELPPEGVNTSASTSSSSKDKGRNGPQQQQHRGRTRTRLLQSTGVAPSESGSTKKSSSISSNSVASTPNTTSPDGPADLCESWLVEDPDSMMSSGSGQQRRSILRCNVNPYDLISISATTPNAPESASVTPTSSNSTATASMKSSPLALPPSTGHKQRAMTVCTNPNEFRPKQNDNFNVEDAALKEEEPPFATSGNTTALSSLSYSTKPLDASDAGMVYTNNNVQAIAGKRISLGTGKGPSKTLRMQHSGGDHKAAATEILSLPKAAGSSVYNSLAQPKRPPRGKRQESLEAAEKPSQLRSEVAQTLPSTYDSRAAAHSPLPPSEPAPLVLTVKPMQNIKSILKRSTPVHSISMGGESSSEQGEASSPGIRRTNSLHFPGVTAETPLASLMAPSDSGIIASATNLTIPQSQSQFYIPMPMQSQQQTRKKVQFIIEEKTVIDSEDEAKQEPQNSEIQEVKKELKEDEGQGTTPQRPYYEYYNRKRKEQARTQQHLQQVTKKAVTSEESPHYEDVATPGKQPAIGQDPDEDPVGDEEGQNSDYLARMSPELPSSPTQSLSSPQTPSATTTSYEKKRSPPIKPSNIVTGQQQQRGDPGGVGKQKGHHKDLTTAAVTTTRQTDDNTQTKTKKNDLQALGPSDNDNPGPRVANNRQQQQEQPKDPSLPPPPRNQQNEEEQIEAVARHQIRRSLSERQQLPQRHHQQQHHPLIFNVKPTSEGCAATEGRQSASSSGPVLVVAASCHNGYNVKFKDTLALRVPQPGNAARSDSRKLFAEASPTKDSLMVSLNRPREPPPPPPPPPTTPPPPLPDSEPPSLEEEGEEEAVTTVEEEQTKKPLGIGATETNGSTTANLYLPQTAKQQNIEKLSNLTGTTTKKPIVERCGRGGLGADKAGAGAKGSGSGAKGDGSGRPEEEGAAVNASQLPEEEKNRKSQSVDRDEQTVPVPIDAAVSPANEAKYQKSVINNKTAAKSSAARNSSGESNKPLSSNGGGDGGLVAPQQQLKQQPRQNGPQRTVVRVAPFNKAVATASASNEVHRLKINHTDETLSPEQATESSFHMQPYQQHYHQQQQHHVTSFGGSGSVSHLPHAKKTSILINGDDCYSTMNLSCDDDSMTPHYQSSVVVTDCSGASSNLTAAPSNGSQTTTAGGFATQLLSATTAHHYEKSLKVTTTSNTVTINVSSPRSTDEEVIYQHNKLNTLLSRQAATPLVSPTSLSSRGAIIPIIGTAISNEVNLQRSASSTSSTSSSSLTSLGSSSGRGISTPKRSRTLIKVDYEQQQQAEKGIPQQKQEVTNGSTKPTSADDPKDPANALDEEPTEAADSQTDGDSLVSHEEELLKILRNPVEAVKRNLVPHVCGRHESGKTDKDSVRSQKMKEANHFPQQGQDEQISTMAGEASLLRSPSTTSSSKAPERNSFIAKLLEDPTLSQVADGLETDTVAELIENSLRRLKRSRNAIDITGTKDNDDMNRLINVSLLKVKEERQASQQQPPHHLSVPCSSIKEEDRHSHRGSISSANSFASANNFEMFDSFEANESDCYQSCSSEITSPDTDDGGSSAATRSKFYQMLVDATLAEIEMSTTGETMGDCQYVDDHHYESIRLNGDPIYEEINEVPPPLPLTAPPQNDPDLEKKVARSIFEGASKYDILSYLVDAKERGLVREEPSDCPLNCSINPIIIEEEAGDTLSELGKRLSPLHCKKEASMRAASVLSDSSEDTQSTMSSLSPPPAQVAFIYRGSAAFSSSLLQRKSASASDIERNDSGVGSETSKSSRSKYQQFPHLRGGGRVGGNSSGGGHSQPGGICGHQVSSMSKNSPIHLCEDCDGTVETQYTDTGVMYVPLVCRKCGKKRVERKEIITEIVETEEKYGRDLQIILEEFCHPMLVAGLLTQDQLSAIFLNTEELLENNQTLAERMRDALDIAIEQGDDDLLTVNIGRIVLDFTQMLHAFESYCVRQAGASLLLANLEKEKELLRIFLKVSQMENAVLRRMNLNSFLMVPVQRVTKYPLLLARLYKVTPAHLEGRDLLKQAQEKIELHLNHINHEAKDVPTKLWRRISSSSPNRRASCEIDMINIKLRKMAIDILEWNHDEVRFAMEGKLLYTQPTDSNWKKARTIKLTPINALLVTNGKPTANYKAEKVMTDKLNFPNRHTGIREASLLVVKEKCGRYTLIREPLYLDRCVVCSEADWDDYFEVQEISSKDTFIFKAEDGVRTKHWYTQLQYHAQGMGAWRKRRSALANIMINGMTARN